MKASCVCVCGEQNGKEANSKCGKTASASIVRLTILGGTGVIQHRVWIKRNDGGLVSWAEITAQGPTANQ